MWGLHSFNVEHNVEPWAGQMLGSGMEFIGHPVGQRTKHPRATQATPVVESEVKVR